MLLPDIADVAELLGAVEPTARCRHAHGVELTQIGILFRHICVTTDNATAVAFHADDTAMLPVASLLLVRAFEKTEQILAHVVLLGSALDLLDETRPWTVFQFVELGSLRLFRHLSSFVANRFRNAVYISVMVIAPLGHTVMQVSQPRHSISSPET